MHIHGCKKTWAIQMPKFVKMRHSYTFFIKKEFIIYVAALKKGLYTHTYYVKYRELPPHPLDFDSNNPYSLS